MTPSSVACASSILLVLAATVTVTLAINFAFGPLIKSAWDLDEDVQRDLRSVIQQWNSDRAFDRKPGVIISSQFANLNLRETDSRFDQYALQVDNSTYSIVHLQKRLVFDAAVIRSAFEISMDTRSHVLFTQPFGIHAHPEGKMYFSCQFSNKKGYPYWVWTLKEVLDKLKSKLGIKNCEELKSTNDFFSDVLSIDR